MTDDPIFDAVTLCLDHERATEEASALPAADGHAIAELCLPTPSLAAIADLPVDRLLAIRRRHAPQRRHFREAVQTQVAAIAGEPTREAIEERLKALEEAIRDDLEAAREAVKDAKTKDRWSLLGVSAPTSIAAAVSIASSSPVLGPVGGMGTLALGVTSWFMQKKKKKGIRTAESHYLLSVDAAVKTPWQRLTGALRDVVQG